MSFFNGIKCDNKKISSHETKISLQETEISCEEILVSLHKTGLKQNSRYFLRLNNRFLSNIANYFSYFFITECIIKYVL